MGSKAILLNKVGEALKIGGRKITVVGAGNVGTAIITSLLTKNITNEVCLVDVSKEKMEGEIMDLQHGATFVNNAKITGSTDYACTECSNICIIAAGARGQDKQSNLDLLLSNVDIVKGIVPKILKYSPDTFFLLVSNPVDALSYAVWKESGLPANRVIGTGTSLDSCRFQCFIAERLGIASGAIQGWVIGEHGANSVPCWSSVSVGGTFLSDIHPDIGKDNDPEKWNEITSKVRNAADEIIAFKGATWWAVGLCAAHIVSSILDNTFDVSPVTTNVKGLHDITEDLFMSLPCVIGINGVTSIINQKLSCEEKEGLKLCEEIILKQQKAIFH